MKPTLCSRCKKNVAVVFITRLDPNGQNSHNEGLCVKCSRELTVGVTGGSVTGCEGSAT